jgi:hypothetical protein
MKTPSFGAMKTPLLYCESCLPCPVTHAVPVWHARTLSCLPAVLWVMSPCCTVSHAYLVLWLMQCLYGMPGHYHISLLSYESCLPCPVTHGVPVWHAWPLSCLSAVLWVMPTLSCDSWSALMACLATIMSPCCPISHAYLVLWLMECLYGMPGHYHVSLLSYKSCLPCPVTYGVPVWHVWTLSCLPAVL